MAESTYSREQIEQWQQNLESIAQKPRTSFTKRQAVEALIDTIELTLQTRSYDEVASGLKEWGLDISAGSLKQYVTRYRKAHPSKGATTGRKRSGLAKRKKSTAQAVAKDGRSASMTAQPGDGKSAAMKGDQTRSSRFIEMDEDL